MPSFDQYPESDLIKAVYMGDSGTGKTGSLCSLAAVGYNVRILDVDKGAQIIRGYATSEKDDKGQPNIYTQGKPPLWTKEQCGGIASRMDYVQISESFTNIGGRPAPKGDSWQKIMAQLTDWKDGERSLGRLESWTSNDVLVIDSFSRVCDARMYLELVMNGRAIAGRQQSDYWKVQDDLERFLELLVSPAVKCHVLLVCHIEYNEKDDKTIRGMPQSMGKALGPKIGQHFNHMIMARTTGQGTGISRKILTQTTGSIDLKTSAPLRVKSEYALETGLAEYFQAVLGHPPEGPKQAAQASKPVT